MILTIVGSCGLPSLTESELEPSRPEVAGFYNGNSIEIDISGAYPSDLFPNFNGFNIYFAENNEETNIYKRVLYIDDSTRLPSVRVSGLDREAHTVILSNEFRFRLTGNSTEEDREDELSDTSSRPDGDAFIRSIRTYDRFYFIVRPFNDFVEHDRSETLRVFIPVVTNGRPIGISAPTDPPNNNIREFVLSSPEEPGLNNTIVFSFTLRTNSVSNSITIEPNEDTILGTFFSAQTSETGCYENYAFPSTGGGINGLTAGELPITTSGAYFFTNTFTSGNTNFSNYQYRLFIEAVNGPVLTICTAYER